MSEADVDRCWVKMEPLLKEVTRLVQDAPLSARDRTQLAVLCASHLFGAVCAAFQEEAPEKKRPLYETAREVADVIVDLMREREVN